MLNCGFREFSLFKLIMSNLEKTTTTINSKLPATGRSESKDPFQDDIDTARFYS